MDKKKILHFNSFSSSSSQHKEYYNSAKKGKKEIVIDLTLSDEDCGKIKRYSSSNPNPKTKNPKKKRKLNNSESFSFSNSDDDELSDDIYSLLPLTQDFDIKNRNKIYSENKTDSVLFDEKLNSFPYKKRKEYKLSNVQVNIF